MPLFTALASSTFTRANENPLSEGGVWTTSSGETALQIVSNAVTPTNLGVDCGAHYNAVTFPNNQYSRAALTVTGTVGASSGPGLKLRQAAAANTFYYFVIDHAVSNNATIGRVVAATFSNLVLWTQAFTDGDQFTFAVEGQVLYVYDKNLVLVKSFDDSAGGGPTSGPVGIEYSATETSCSVDNWEGGSFASAGQGTISGVAFHPGRSPGKAPFSARFWQPPQATVIPISTAIIAPTEGLITIDGYAPSVTLAIAAIAGAIVISGNAPSITTTLAPSEAAVVISGNAPSITTTIAASTGAVTIGGNAPALTSTLAPSEAAVVISGNVPDLPSGTITPTEGAIVFSGNVPDVTTASLIVPTIPTTTGGAGQWITQLPRLPEKKRVVFQRNVENRDRHDIEDIMKILRDLL